RRRFRGDFGVRLGGERSARPRPPLGEAGDDRSTGRVPAAIAKPLANSPGSSGRSMREGGRGRALARRSLGEQFSKALCAFPPNMANRLPLQTMFVAPFVGGHCTCRPYPNWPAHKVKSRRCRLFGANGLG